VGRVFRRGEKRIRTDFFGVLKVGPFLLTYILKYIIITINNFFTLSKKISSVQSAEPTAHENSAQKPQPLSSKIGIISGIRKSAFGAVLGMLGVLAAENAGAFGEIKLKNLSFLEPTAENLSPNSKPYPPIISPSQLPPLWPCDDIGTKDKGKFGMDVESPSLVFEVTKRIEGSIRSVHGQNVDRLRLLGVLKNVLDTYQIDSPSFGVGVVPDHQKKLKQLNDLYQKNLEATQNLVALWDSLHKTVSEIRASVKQLVLDEMRVGKRAEKCAKPQEDVGEFRLFQLLPTFTATDVGEYLNYDGLVPKGLFISPYVCANLSKGKAAETDSELYRWLDQLEKVMTEHVYASMERQRAYIENADRLTGAIGPGKEAERNAFNSVLIVRDENQKILEQWKQLIIKVQALKAETFKVINTETALARKLKRCTRVKTSDPSGDSAPVDPNDGGTVAK